MIHPDANSGSPSPGQVLQIGLGVTGLAELLLALLTGWVGLMGDAIHNLSDVSTSAVVFLGSRLSRRPPTKKYPYGLEREEDLGIAVVMRGRLPQPCSASRAASLPLPRRFTLSMGPAWTSGSWRTPPGGRARSG